MNRKNSFAGIVLSSVVVSTTTQATEETKQHVFDAINMYNTSQVLTRIDQIERMLGEW